MSIFLGAPLTEFLLSRIGEKAGKIINSEKLLQI